MSDGAAPVGALDLDPGTERPLVFATYLAPALFPVYRSITAAAGNALAIETRLAVGSSFGQLIAGAVDVAFVCGLPYVRLSQHLEPLAAPVVSDARYGGLPVYFSDVIVRTDSPFRTFADLHGASWSFNDPDSHSGYLMTLSRLLDMGDYGQFFSRVVDAGWHQVSIDLVATGRVDASAVDSHVLAVELRNRPELGNQLRVIDSFGPSPIQPIVARRSLDPRLRERLREALTRLVGEELGHGLVARLVPITDDWYDPIRALLARVDRVGLALRPTDPGAAGEPRMLDRGTRQALACERAPGSTSCPTPAGERPSVSQG